MLFKQFLSAIIRPSGKISFISKLKPNSKLFDVGCGNNSPYFVKKILPKCHYTGIDIGDYNQIKPNLADKYIVTTPSDFANEIRRLENTFDAVISTHNLEHCNDRNETLKAMLFALKKDGELFISFPSEGSVNFPSRQGTLNYFDDETHKHTPPIFQSIVDMLDENNFQIIYSIKSYRPFLLRTLGFLFEPISKVRKKVLIGTWEYYGFESIIRAKKL